MKDRTKSIISLIVYFIGGATLLSAWCAQSVFQAKYFEQKLYLEKTQLISEINQSELAVWQQAIVDHDINEPIQSRILAKIYYEYCRLFHKMLAHEYTRNTLGKDSSAIQYKNLELKQLKSALRLVSRNKPEEAKATLAKLQKMSILDFDEHIVAEVNEVESNDVSRRILKNIVFPSKFSEQERNEAKYGLIYLFAKAVDSHN